MESLAILILAAGQGTRMGSDLPKVLHQADGIPLIHHVLSTARALGPERIVVITGFQREAVEAAVQSNCPSAQFAFQKEQKGTGDAVRAALPALEGFSGTVLILYGDVPLVTTDTLHSLLVQHKDKSATLSLISFICAHPGAYGRIVRSAEDMHVEKIVEAKDCTPAQFAITEVNSGIYAVDSAFLKPAVESLSNENTQGEYYLTDIVERAAQEGQRVLGVIAHEPQEMLGVNTRWDLLLVERELHTRRVRELVNSGVSVLDPDSLYIESTVSVAPGAQLGPSVTLLGSTHIAEGAQVIGTACIKDSQIESEAVVKLGVHIEGARVGKNCSVGPFAHLRPGTELGADVKIGNFVETKKATLADGAKASHLSYLGDCEVGKNANIGAGTITCNYDGYQKSKTVIGEGAFIGSNSSLIAPVKIGDGATVGAGSAISRDVAADSLAVTRAKQIEKAGWSAKKREQNKK